MNILIVDDEILAIENVENALKNISVPDTRGRNVFRMGFRLSNILVMSFSRRNEYM